MNHSKAFWGVRNQYADQMRLLWARGFLGEGLWGRGAHLTTGKWEKNSLRGDEVLPEHLCGGTYRSRGRKRKAKKVLTYQEQKERRILKKFGANGVTLGEDKEVKKKLEKGRQVAAKPRVAGSARGRELRAAAALARFDQKKNEEVAKEQKVKQEAAGDDEVTASEAETESGDDYDDGQPEALNLDGTKILDAKGHRMIKVCEDENPDERDAQNELLELRSSFVKPLRKAPTGAKGAVDTGLEKWLKTSQPDRERKQDTPSAGTEVVELSD
jgi:hypothetical protein